MKITISVIKADIGSIGGHICPSQRLMETVDAYVTEHGAKLLLDSYISYTGDDIAIVSTHERGPNDAQVHKLCWDAFMAGAAVAKDQGLYGAGPRPAQRSILRQCARDGTRCCGTPV